MTDAELRERAARLRGWIAGTDDSVLGLWLTPEGTFGNPQLNWETAGVLIEKLDEFDIRWLRYRKTWLATAFVGMTEDADYPSKPYRKVEDTNPVKAAIRACVLALEAKNE